MTNEGVRPARPHHKLTEDGRRMREVLTYSRRGSRFTPRQQAALGRAPRGVGDPRRGRRRARLPAGGVVRSRGAAGRRDRLGRRRGDRRRSPPPARRTTCWRWRSGARASPTRWAGWPRPGPTNVRFCCASTRCGRSSTWSSRGAGRAVDVLPRPVAQDSGTTSAGWSTPAFARAGRLPAGARRRVAAGHRLGRLRRADGARCSTPSRCSIGGVVERWAERPVTKFERKGLAAGRADHRPGLPAARLSALSWRCST